MNNPVLSGVKVVELTTYVAAPICGRMLVDLGADVIKVESAKGDNWRAMGNIYRIPATEEENPLFDVYNAGKKGVVLNLKDEGGKAAFFRLLDTADIFITNTRIPSLKRLGIDYESIKEKFPRLIYGVITGYGEKGPDANRPGFDNVAFWGMSGFLTDMQFIENPYPLKAPAGVGDSVAGTNLLAGLLAALYRREVSGKGDYVSVSLFNTATWVMSCMIICAQPKYGYQYPYSVYEASIYTSAYRCADNEWLNLTILDPDRYMHSFFEALGRLDLLEDPRFATPEAQSENRVDLHKIIDPIFLNKTSDEWLHVFQAQDIVCCKAGHFSTVSSSEQAWANGNMEHYVLRNGDQCILPCSPIRLSSTEILPGKPSPLIGEDTVSVLRKIGYTEDKIEQLLENKAAKQHL